MIDSYDYDGYDDADGDVDNCDVDGDVHIDYGDDDDGFMHMIMMMTMMD
jgi:hypothetical protein